MANTVGALSGAAQRAVYESAHMTLTATPCERYWLRFAIKKEKFRDLSSVMVIKMIRGWGATQKERLDFSVPLPH